MLVDFHKKSNKDIDALLYIYDSLSILVVSVNGQRVDIRIARRRLQGPQKIRIRQNRVNVCGFKFVRYPQTPGGKFAALDTSMLDVEDMELYICANTLIVFKPGGTDPAVYEESMPIVIVNDKVQNLDKVTAHKVFNTLIVCTPTEALFTYSADICDYATIINKHINMFVIHQKTRAYVADGTLCFIDLNMRRVQLFPVAMYESPSVFLEDINDFVQIHAVDTHTGAVEYRAKNMNRTCYYAHVLYEKNLQGSPTIVQHGEYTALIYYSSLIYYQKTIPDQPLFNCGDMITMRDLRKLISGLFQAQRAIATARSFTKEGFYHFAGNVYKVEPGFVYRMVQEKMLAVNDQIHMPEIVGIIPNMKIHDTVGTIDGAIQLNDGTIVCLLVAKKNILAFHSKDKFQSVELLPFALILDGVTYVSMNNNITRWCNFAMKQIDADRLKLIGDIPYSCRDDVIFANIGERTVIFQSVPRGIECIKFSEVSNGMFVTIAKDTTQWRILVGYDPDVYEKPRRTKPALRSSYSDD